MKKAFLLLLLPFFFHHILTAQSRNGVRAIARYADTLNPPRLDPSDGLPEFEGGIEAFKAAFLKEFIFPAASLESEKGGEGVIGFTIDTLGNVYDLEVIDAVTPEIDAEALYVFSKICRFPPIWRPMKLAVLYRAYPSIYKDEQAYDRLDSLVKTQKVSELAKFVDKNRPYAVLSAHIGATVPTEQLNRYINPLFQLSGQIDVFKDRWGGSLAGTLRASSVRKDFDYDDIYWDKDSSIALHSVGLFLSYRLVQEQRLIFTPFVGFNTHFLLLTSDSYDTSPSIVSFLPTLGGSVDLIFRQKANNEAGTLHLNTQAIRLHFAVNLANFKDGRRGNLVDLGVGYSFSTRELFVNH
jgi:hypothetical protein